MADDLVRSWLLSQGLQRTVSAAFEQLLSNQISIPQGTRSTAGTSQNHLRDFLISEAENDSRFPRILSQADSDFMGGSFARHTKIWPLDDIDIYLPIDGKGLIYSRGGIRLPFAVLSDNPNGLNPILNDRWMRQNYVSSTQLVEGFAAVLRRHYPQETEVYANGEAVSVRMSYGEGDESDGLGYDVVPCFSLKPDNSDEWPFYLMPDGNNGWIRTNPRLDTVLADRLHTGNNQVYRKVVRLVKFWNAETLGGAIESYYVELAIARAFWEKNTARRETVNSVSEGVAIGFSALYRALQQGNQHSWIADAPPVVPGELTLADRQTLSNVCTLVSTARANELGGREAAAIQAWKGVFGSAFGE